jgi:hypothetical protein
MHLERQQLTRFHNEIADDHRHTYIYPDYLQQKLLRWYFPNLSSITYKRHDSLFTT